MEKMAAIKAHVLRLVLLERMRRTDMEIKIMINESENAPPSALELIEKKFENMNTTINNFAISDLNALNFVNLTLYSFTSRLAKT